MIQPKKSLRGIHRHSLPKESRHAALRLDKNENVGDIHPSIIKAMLAGFTSDVLTAYPEYHGIHAKLASKFGLSDDYFLVTNGSDSASKLIFDTFIDSGDEVVLTNPTFAMHKVYASITQSSLVEVPYGSDFKFPHQGVLDAMTSKTRLVVLVTPVNPVGTVIGREQMTEIVEKAAKNDTLVFIDEAYVEFYGSSFIDLVPKHDNILITRTFSKAYGLPSARLGYVVANPRLTSFLRITQPTYDVNQFAVQLGEYLLDHDELLNGYLDQVKEGRQWLTDRLTTEGLEYHAGHGNFILIRVGECAPQVVQDLRTRDILVGSDFSLPSLKGWLRASLGPKAKMARFIEGLQEALKK